MLYSSDLLPSNPTNLTPEDMVVLESKSVFCSCLLLLVSLCSGTEYQVLIASSLPPPLTLHSQVPKSTQYDEAAFSRSASLEDHRNSFSVGLHHVDALLSSGSNSTAEDLFISRLERDARRVNHIHAAVAAAVARASSASTFGVGKTRAGGFSTSIVSGLSVGSGEYFSRLGIGTPASNVYLVLDTGSDINWMQCMPCRTCYKQTTPIFEPSRSTTYRIERCGSPLCNQLESPGCSAATKSCLYQVSYGDGSFTVGDFATETLSFRHRTKIQNVAFGCGHDNQGLFVGAAGLLGLGRGPLSFTSRVGPQFAHKFSYCLSDRSASKPSSLMFGETSVSRRAVFTPLVKNDKLDTFYYVPLTGISVGSARVRGVNPSLFRIDATTGDGGVIIDSGTSVTRLVGQAYAAFRDAFRAGARRLKRADGFSLFDTCFDLAGKPRVLVPKVTLHFVGADVSLPATNYLIPVDSAGKYCLAFAPTGSGLSIIGNIQQQGFRVSFDTSRSQVGFAPNSCA